jgi:hypothetical protein
MAQKLDPWRVLEFFRVEALLRNQKVMDLYKDKGTDEQFRYAGGLVVGDSRRTCVAKDPPAGGLDRCENS